MKTGIQYDEWAALIEKHAAQDPRNEGWKSISDLMPRFGGRWRTKQILNRLSSLGEIEEGVFVDAKSNNNLVKFYRPTKKAPNAKGNP